MAIEYFAQPIYNENILNIINTIFVTVYGLEMVFKLIGLNSLSDEFLIMGLLFLLYV